MSDTDVFRQINNALLDLQQASHQTFEHPLRRLGKLFESDDLAGSVAVLTKDVDLDDFLERSNQTGGSMVGSQRLLWPDDPKKVMGLNLLLIKRFAEDPRFAVNFGHTFYYSNSKLISGVHAIVRQQLLPFIRDFKDYILAKDVPVPKIVRPLSRKIFIVHGHDGEARESVARFLERLEFAPIILHEQANQGRTVIEKVEANSDVGFAIVLLTPDDEGCKKGDSPEPRARQNVLLELGYSLGKLGRDRVCAFRKGEVVIPSDFAGVVWEPMDANGAWKTSLGRELSASGYVIDWNKIMA